MGQGQRDNMSVTPPDINHVVGDCLTSSQHCLNMERTATLRRNRNRNPADLPVFLQYDFDTLPNLSFALIQSAEITSRILLPVSNGETEVNDQKEVFCLFVLGKEKEGKKLDAKLAKESTVDN